LLNDRRFFDICCGWPIDNNIESGRRGVTHLSIATPGRTQGCLNTKKYFLTWHDRPNVIRPLTGKIWTTGTRDVFFFEDPLGSRCWKYPRPDWNQWDPYK